MTEQEALAAAIRGEDAAVYAYGVIGARVPPALQRRARRALLDHRSARSALQLRAAQQVAVPPAFDLPQPVDSTADARALAVTVEQRLAAVYSDLAAASSGDNRDAAVRSAMECATRAVTWGGTSQAFPGA